jgi:hypothetical protein
MKYLAICFLSLAAFLTAGTAPSVSAEINSTVSASALAAPARVSAPGSAASLSASRDGNTPDRALAGVLAAALVALQLRRRQKSLRMPRQFS